MIKCITILKSIFTKKRTDEDKIKDLIELTGWQSEFKRRTDIDSFKKYLLFKYGYEINDATYYLSNNPNKLLLEATEQYLER